MSATVSAVDVSYDPGTGERQRGVAHTTSAMVEAIVNRATTAADELAATAPSVRQTWLAAVSDALLAHEEELALLGDEETGLGLPRLRGEIAGAARSLLFYASVAVEGSYLNVSNFPFGFGVFGHDVASALAAGCPVIAKAHPAHPRLSARLSVIARSALLTAGAPEGTYDLVTGFDSGLHLVDSPAISTVAFTGSQRGGMALLAKAAARGVPVFAEMGTVNPAFVTAAAAVADTAAIATGFVADVPPEPLLTAGIAASFTTGIAELAVAAESTSRSTVPAGDGYFVAAQVFRVALADLIPVSRLREECFGPVALVCEHDDTAEALPTLVSLQGSLAASVVTGGPTDPETHAVVERLLPNVGRGALNARPTGVTNTSSQHHGGPGPATSRLDSTSVGAGALDRFVRPAALQNAAPETLPVFLSADNPWQIPRRIDGALITPTRSPISKDIS